ncbi:unnamed protein product [Schistocephalus solidus]|uniref:Transposase n=1 Tax=Schistocephalus solidus TaxID=70667 RepID=A0A183TPM6_SCHSO|nr:unnamed protein product [Schistocephalus solidus]
MMREWVHWLTGPASHLHAPQDDTRVPKPGVKKEPSPSDSQSTDPPLNWTDGVAWYKRQLAAFQATVSRMS